MNDFDNIFNDQPQFMSVAARKKQIAATIKNLTDDGLNLSPVVIKGRKIAKNFWGKSWCENIEAYADSFFNRADIGRRYALHGAVIDLKITPGKISALVCGANVYKLTISIAELTDIKQKQLINSCSGKIASMLDLLQ